MSNTISYNKYSIGLTVNSIGDSSLPLGSFCTASGIIGTFTINSQIDSSSGSCAKMSLYMDSTRKIFRANYPFPNLECTVNFKC